MLSQRSDRLVILQTLLTAISMVRDELGQTPAVVQQFLVDLLTYNDNLGNKVCSCRASTRAF